MTNHLFFRVRNFEEFQHYSHRNPPWIRLYYRILHDLRFYCLDDSTKYLAIGCFLLASQHQNKIPFDQRWIRKELSLTSTPNWKALLDAEFIQPIDCTASELLASCQQDASRNTDNSEYSDNSEVQIIQKTEILSNSQKSANPSGPVPGEALNQRPASADATLGEKQRSAKTEILRASEIFKCWNNQPATMHHRSMNGQEKAIRKALRRYTPEQIFRAIERYSQVRANAAGKYRELYAWTLGEFLTRKDHYNIERFNCDNWEEPFLAGAVDNGRQVRRAPSLAEELFGKRE